VLIPAVVELVKGKTSPLTGKPVQVIAAGGIHNGQLLAASLMMGASAVWVGTRFILTDEAGAPKAHKEAVRTAGFDDNIRTIIFTGRPMRVRNNAYINEWETERQNEIRELTSKGIVPFEHDIDRLSSGKAAIPKSITEILNKSGEDSEIDDVIDEFRPYLMGKAAAVVNENKSAKAVVDEFVNDAAAWIRSGNKMLAKL